MVKTIVFDLGGVLLDWNPRYLYRKLFTEEKEVEYFLEEICSPQWNAQMDASKPFQEAIDELSLEHPEFADQIQAYFSRWEEMMGGMLPETVELLGELKGGDWPLAALSNWSAETFPRVRHVYDFLDWFDPLIISGDVGAAKPDPAIYRHLLRVLDLPAGECLFIDDSYPNILTAQQLGFPTVHFQSPDHLRKELVGRGLL